MPRDDDTPICGTSKRICYDEAEDDLLHQHYTAGISANDISQNECNCLPACTSIRYDGEVSQASFDWKRLAAAFNNTYEDPG